MTIINLTPHSIDIINDADVRIVSIPSSGVARADTDKTPAAPVIVAGVEIPVVVVEFGAPIDLPDPADGVQLIVSTITAQSAAQAGRTTADLLTPDGAPVRDADGQILGVRALARVAS